MDQLEPLLPLEKKLVAAACNGCLEVTHVHDESELLAVQLGDDADEALLLVGVVRRVAERRANVKSSAAGSSPASSAREREPGDRAAETR